MKKYRRMSFSTRFPAYHPRKDEETFFIEKIWSGLFHIDRFWYSQFLPGWGESLKEAFELYKKYRAFDPKYHTIRAGKKWKVGDVIVPYVWSGKPYRSKTIKPFGDLGLPVEKVWDFDIDENGVCSIDGVYMLDYEDRMENEAEGEIAKNDGLSHQDFVDWIIMPVYQSGRPFNGQIISWNHKLSYTPNDTKS